MIIAQSDPGLDLPARAQLSPHDWDLLDKTLSILKPAFVCTKEAESENCSISDVIPLVKKLNFQVESVVVSGIGTFKSLIKLEMKKYFDDK